MFADAGCAGVAWLLEGALGAESAATLRFDLMGTLLGCGAWLLPVVAGSDGADAADAGGAVLG